MSLKCGIVGLPNVGKSTLFNALTKAAIPAENYPFCTIEPNVGIVPVPDPRLAKIAEIAKPAKVTPAVGRVRGHRGPGRRRLQGRGPRQPVPRPHPRDRRHHQHGALLRRTRTWCTSRGGSTRSSDIETIQTELALADLATVEKAQIRNVSRVKSGDKEAIKLEARARAGPRAPRPGQAGAQPRPRARGDCAAAAAVPDHREAGDLRRQRGRAWLQGQSAARPRRGVRGAGGRAGGGDLRRASRPRWPT